MRGLLILLPVFTWQAAYAALCNKHDPRESNLFFGEAGPTWMFHKHEENCDQEYDLSRCFPQAYLNPGTNWTVNNSTGFKTCLAFSPLGRSYRKCTPSKFTCNDTLSCPDLLDLKTDLMAGGHNIVCRHEKTYWPMFFGEVHGCQKSGNCLENRIVQRQLHPDGYRNGEVFANAFKEMGIPIGRVTTSDMTRCSKHAELFGEAEIDWQIQYEGTWRETADYYGFSKEGGSFPIHSHQAHNMRDALGRPPANGTNNIMVSHGFNIYRATGLTTDEGYCLVFKPDTSQPTLAETVGTVHIDDRNTSFTYPNGSYPLNLIARMSPESAKLMQTCSEAQEASQNSPDASSVFKYDLNSDMRISFEEYFLESQAKSETSEAQALAAFKFLRELQPMDLLGKDRSHSTDIEVGQWFHIDWGWNDLASGTGTMNFWRHIIENSIGRQGHTAEERVASFVQANAIMSAVFDAVLDGEAYPDGDAMEDKLLNCTSKMSPAMTECFSKTNMRKSGGDYYFPMLQPGQAAFQQYNGMHLGEKMPLPATYEPDFHTSKLMKAAVCLVEQEEIELWTLMMSMGCPPPPREPEILPGVPHQSFNNASELATMLRDEKILNCEVVLSFGSLAEFNVYLNEEYTDKGSCAKAGGKYSSSKGCGLKGALKCKNIKLKNVCDAVGCTFAEKCTGRPVNLP